MCFIGEVGNSVIGTTVGVGKLNELPVKRIRAMSENVVQKTRKVKTHFLPTFQRRWHPPTARPSKVPVIRAKMAVVGPKPF